MAKRGRKPSSAPRYPCGKPKSQTVLAQLEAAERARQEAEMATVLAQPHRKGSRSQLAESALGRFCEAHKLRSELYDSGLQYARTRQKWVVAWGAKMDGLEGGSGGEVPAYIMDAWRAEVEACESAMLACHEIDPRAYGPAAIGWVKYLALDDKDPLGNIDPIDATTGLMACALALGKIDPKSLRVPQKAA